MTEGKEADRVVGGGVREGGVVSVSKRREELKVELDNNSR
jgi:hypothetical protein